MPDWLQTYLQNWGANQPVSPLGAPSYGIGPGVLGMADPMRMTGVPGAPSMGYPAMGQPPPAIDATIPQFNVSPSLANAPLPPPRPKGKIDPKKVDLGMNQRFVPIQYQVPSGRGPLGNNPIYTALNLGGQS